MVGISLSAQINPINDSTISRYRCEVEEYTVSTVISLDSVQELDVLERELFQPSYRHYEMTKGVNAQYHSYFQIETWEATHLEEWMSHSEFTLLTPFGSYGINALGEKEFQLPHKSIELQDFEAERMLNQQNGFQPVMMFFPNRRSEMVSNALSNGALLTELSGDAFKLTWTDIEVEIDPELQEITQIITHDDEVEKIVEGYELFAPYGYVVSYRYTETTRTDIASPMTFKKVQRFSNHVIEDQNNLIPKYTDQALIEVYPVPVNGEYEIVFKGVPDAQVSQVLIHDFMGNIVATHLSPQVVHDVIQLDASTYPSGVLIAVVYTQQGVYTETFTKS